MGELRCWGRGLRLRLGLWLWLGLWERLGMRLGGCLGLGRQLRRRSSGEDGGAREHGPASPLLPEGVLQLEYHAEGDGALAGGAAGLGVGRRHGDSADRLPAAGQSA